MLNRIKYLEEEEKRSKIKLQQAGCIQQKQEEGKQLRESLNTLSLKRIDLLNRDLSDKEQLVSSIKEGRSQLKERIKQHEEYKKQEAEEFKKKMSYFKEMHKEQQVQLATINILRRNEVREMNERMKEENRIRKEEIAKQKNQERQQAKIKNETAFQERTKEIVSMKEQMVQNVKQQRVGYDTLQSMKMQQTSDIAAQTHMARLERESERLQEMERALEELRVREIEAKRRLEEAERRLSPGSPEERSPYSSTRKLKPVSFNK